MIRIPAILVTTLILHLSLLIPHPSQAQWQEINDGPCIGNVEFLVFKGNLAFAASYSKGITRSDDGGLTWTPANNGLTYTDMAVLAVQQDNIFAGSVAHGVYLSTDNGASWLAVNNGLTSQRIRYLKVSGKRVYAGTEMGLFVTHNNGANWTLVANGLPKTRTIAMAVYSTEMYVETYLWNGGNYASLIYKSTDNGSTWYEFGGGEWVAETRALVCDEKYVYAATSQKGMMRSSRLKPGWEKINNGFIFDPFHILTLGVFDHKIYAGSPGGVYISADKGNNWTASNNSLTVPQIYCFADHNGSIFAGTTNGVFVTSDSGASWTSLSKRLSCNYVNGLLSQSGCVLASTYEGMFRTQDYGATWNPSNEGLSLPRLGRISTDGSSLVVSNGPYV